MITVQRAAEMRDALRKIRAGQVSPDDAVVTLAELVAELLAAMEKLAGDGTP